MGYAANGVHRATQDYLLTPVDTGCRVVAVSRHARRITVSERTRAEAAGRAAARANARALESRSYGLTVDAEIAWDHGSGREYVRDLAGQVGPENVRAFIQAYYANS